MPISYEQLKTSYHFFIHLFAYEFVYDRFPADDLNDEHFDQYLSHWLRVSYLVPLDNSTYKINPAFHQQISLLTSPFEQYARAYLLIYELDNLSSEKNLSALIKTYQKTLLAKLQSTDVVSVLASSSNVISNALRTLNFSTKSKTLADVRTMLSNIFPSRSPSAPLRAKL